MLNMVGLILVTHIAFFSVFPILPLHLVQGMRAEDGFVALFGLFELAGGVIISTRTERLMQQFGHRLLIAMAMLGTATATAIIAMAPTLAMTLPAAMLLGASWTAVNIGLMGVMMSNAPTEQSTQYATIFMQSISFATFVGPFIGSQLLNGGLSLVTVLMIGAGLRIAAAALATVAFKTDAPIHEERYG
jgi:MFS family permease